MMTSTKDERQRSVVQRRSSLLLIAGAMAAVVGRRKNATAATVPAASSLADLKALGPSHQVRAIVHSIETYRVTMADGKTAVFPETNLRFKIDSSFLGPRSGTPVILPAGTRGDRAWVFFAAPGEISTFIAEQG